MVVKNFIVIVICSGVVHTSFIYKVIMKLCWTYLHMLQKIRMKQSCHYSFILIIKTQCLISKRLYTNDWWIRYKFKTNCTANESQHTDYKQSFHFGNVCDSFGLTNRIYTIQNFRTIRIWNRTEKLFLCITFF